jgi:hypothetical protein
MSNSSHSQGILIDKTCPVFPATKSAASYLPAAFATSDPLARCRCPPAQGDVNLPSGFGDLCSRLASPDSVAFIRDGTPSDAVNNTRAFLECLCRRCYHASCFQDSFLALSVSLSSLSLLCFSATNTRTEGQVVDLQFSSSQFRVNAYWSGFEDPESSIEYYAVAVGRALTIGGHLVVDPTAFQPFERQNANETSFFRSTFFFRPGTLVVTTVRAVNKAGLGTIASTNGFIVDP